MVQTMLLPDFATLLMLLMMTYSEGRGTRMNVKWIEEVGKGSMVRIGVEGFGIGERIIGLRGRA